MCTSQLVCAVKIVVHLALDSSITKNNQQNILSCKIKLVIRALYT